LLAIYFGEKYIKVGFEIKEKLKVEETEGGKLS